MGETADFLVIGGGIIGLNLALRAKSRHPGSKVVLIEKEDACGLHASGRNSGVLHAGFYYTADSLKARFTRDGCRRLTQYCLDRGLTTTIQVRRDDTRPSNWVTPSRPGGPKYSRGPPSTCAIHRPQPTLGP